MLIDKQVMHICLYSMYMEVLCLKTDIEMTYLTISISWHWLVVLQENYEKHVFMESCGYNRELLKSYENFNLYVKDMYGDSYGTPIQYLFYKQ